MDELADDHQNDTFETEIFKYLSAPTIPRDSEPLDCWRAQTEYPSLKKVAKKFLTSPLSSVCLFRKAVLRIRKHI